MSNGRQENSSHAEYICRLIFGFGLYANVCHVEQILKGLLSSISRLVDGFIVVCENPL